MRADPGLAANRVLPACIAHLLTRPIGRPPHHVRRWYASFSYRANSWDKARRVVAKVEWHRGELFPVHDGAHDRVSRKTLGVVHVLIASQTAEHRFPKKSHQEMSGVLAAPRLRQNLAAQFGQSKRVMELAVGNKTPIG